MTLYIDSRYANPLLNENNQIPKAWDEQRQAYHIMLLRNWPVYSANFYTYEWKQGDRLDNLANKYLGNSQFWWKIMDINPEIVDPFNMEPGTLIRIPYE